MTETPDLEQLTAMLHAQTAKLEWPELARHFARGVVVKIDPQLDLVRVAVAVVSDDKRAVSDWMASGQLQHADDADARRWTEQSTVFWAVVAAPWVLVQELV
jgi:hypothetical protein